MATAVHSEPTPSVAGTSSVDTRRALRWHLYLACGALVAHLLMTPSCFSPDVFVYAEYGKLMLQGKRLYSEIFLDKPILTPILYALPQLVAPNVYWVFKLCLACVLWLQGYLIIKTMKPPLATSLVVSCVVLFLPLLFWDWEWPSTEHLSNLFVVGVLLLCWRAATADRCGVLAALAIGALLGAAVLVRQTTATTAIVPMATLAAMRGNVPRRLAALALIGVAGATTLLVSVGAAYFLGNVDGYVRTMLMMPGMYSNETLPEMTASFAHYMGMAQECQLMPLLTGAAFLACLPRQRFTLLAGLAAGVLTVAASPRSYGHYAVGMFPGIAVAIAGGLRGDFTSPRWMGEPRPIPAALIGSLLLAMIAPFWSARLVLEISTHWRASNLAAPAEFERWLDQTLPGPRTMWLVAPMNYEYILYASDKTPAHALHTAWEMDRPDLAMGYGGDEAILDDFLESPPDVIVLQGVAYNWIKTGVDRPLEEMDLSRRVLHSLMRRHRYELLPGPFVATSGPNPEEFAVLVLEERRPPNEEDAGTEKSLEHEESAR